MYQKEYSSSKGTTEQRRRKRFVCSSSLFVVVVCSSLFGPAQTCVRQGATCTAVAVVLLNPLHCSAVRSSRSSQSASFRKVVGLIPCLGRVRWAGSARSSKRHLFLGINSSSLQYYLRQQAERDDI